MHASTQRNSSNASRGDSQESNQKEQPAKSRSKRCEPPRLVGHDAHQKALAGLLRDNARRNRLSAVFSDFCEMGALAISNAVDRGQFEAREARYLQIVAKYEPDEVARFPEMLAVLVEWLGLGFADCLGQLFMSLELGDNFKGQFFTPDPVSSLMASLAMTDARDVIARQGFITVNEPACGAGGMVVACADALHAQGINYQQTMHVIAQDIDATAVHMTYLQLALLHVPAIVVHGNTIAMTEWAHWVTPAHVLGGWDHRLRHRSAVNAAAALLDVPAVPAPEEQRAERIADDATDRIAAASADDLHADRASIVVERLGQLSLFG